MLPPRRASAPPARKALVSALIPLVFVAALLGYWSQAPGGEPDSVGPTLAGLCISYLVLWGMIFLLSESSRTEGVTRFGLATASIALMVGLFELSVVTRLVDFRVVFSTGYWPPERHPGNRIDPKLMYIHKPYDDFWWNHLHYRYDRHGLRNKSDLESADIVVTGDSFIEGMGAKGKDLVTVRLSELLGVTVANVAQSGYGPQQELELLRRYGLPLRPRICVWTFFEGNDLWGLLNYEENMADWERRSKELHSFWERSFSRNVLVALRWQVEKAQRNLHLHAAVPPDPGRVSGYFQASSGKTLLTFYHSGHHLSPRDLQALDKLPSILGDAYESCESRDAEFLVVFIPTKFRVYRPFTAFSVDDEPLYWVLNDLPLRLETIIRERLPAAMFLDLTPALREAARRGALVYYDSDAHWNAEGHRVAAETIASELRGGPIRSGDRETPVLEEDAVTRASAAKPHSPTR